MNRQTYRLQSQKRRLALGFHLMRSFFPSEATQSGPFANFAAMSAGSSVLTSQVGSSHNFTRICVIIASRGSLATKIETGTLQHVECKMQDAQKPQGNAHGLDRI